LITVLSYIWVAILIKEDFFSPRKIGIVLKKLTSEFKNRLLTMSHTYRKFEEVSTTTLQLVAHLTIFRSYFAGDEKEGTAPKIVPGER